MSNMDFSYIGELYNKMYNKQVTLFIFVLFVLLSICSPGVFLNDEWVFTNQLSQITDGSDLTYNDGKYGYFEDGTISEYFTARNNVLVYSLAFPILALPAHMIFTLLSSFGSDISLLFCIVYLILAFYLVYFVISNFLKFGVLEYIITSVTFIGFSIWVVTSRNEMIFVGLQSIPSEVLSICFTNMILFSILSVVVYNIVKELIDDDVMQIFVTFSALFTGSLMFWATTCKDHVFIALLIAVIVLFIIKSRYNIKYYMVAVIMSGLLMWARPEVGFGIFVANCLYIVFASENIKKNLVTFFIVYPLSLIPFFVNNYVITGDILKHPFLLGNSQYGETCVNSIGNIVIANTPNTGIDFSWVVNCVNTFIMPYNGGMNLILPFGIFICGIFYIKKNITRNEKILLIFGFGSIIYYMFSISTMMHADQGILPDMRYYSQFYVIATIFGMSLLYKNVEMDAKKMIYWMILSVGFFTPALLLISNVFIDVFGSSYTGFIQLCNVSGIFILLILVISLLKYRTNDDERKYEVFIPALIGLMITLQLILIVVYSDVKMNGYDFITPVGDLLYNLIFIG